MAVCDYCIVYKAQGAVGIDRSRIVSKTCLGGLKCTVIHAHSSCTAALDRFTPSAAVAALRIVIESTATEHGHIFGEYVQDAAAILEIAVERATVGLEQSSAVRKHHNCGSPVSYIVSEFAQGCGYFSILHYNSAAIFPCIRTVFDAGSIGSENAIVHINHQMAAGAKIQSAALAGRGIICRMGNVP